MIMAGRLILGSPDNLMIAAAISTINRTIQVSMQSGPQYRPTSETPSEWRFAGGLIVAWEYMLSGRRHLRRKEVWNLGDSRTRITIVFHSVPEWSYKNNASKTVYTSTKRFEARP